MVLTPEERKERRKVYDQRYRDNNRKLIAKNNKKYRESAKGLVKEQAYLELNKDTIALKHKQYYQKTKEVRDKKNKEWRDNNKERVSELHAARQKRERDGLKDSYIKQKLCQGNSLSAKHIPQSLIKTKRVELLMKRFIKEQKDE